jgi:hypothetical protein
MHCSTELNCLGPIPAKLPHAARMFKSRPAGARGSAYTLHSLRRTGSPYCGRDRQRSAEANKPAVSFYERVRPRLNGP